MTIIARVQKAPVNRFGSGPEGPEKQRQRELVADFVLSNQKGSGRPRILSMPGNSWEFETILQVRTRGEVEHVCVDRDPWRISQGWHAMPGYKRRMTREFFSGLYLEGVRGHGFVIWHAELETFLKTNKRLSGRSNAQCRQFAATHYNFTGAWLDFEGPLSSSSLGALRCMPNKLRRNWWFAHIPIAVTYMVGRERGALAALVRGGASRHSLCVAAFNQRHRAGKNRWRVVESSREAYRGRGGSNMQTSFLLVSQERRR